MPQAATGTCSRRFSVLAAAAAAVGVDGPPLPPPERASSARVGIGSASGAGLVENPGPANTVELGLVERAGLTPAPEDLYAAAGLALTTRARCVLPSLRMADAQGLSASEKPRMARYIPAHCQRAVYRHQPQAYVAWTPLRRTSQQPSTAVAPANRADERPTPHSMTRQAGNFISAHSNLPERKRSANAPGSRLAALRARPGLPGRTAG